MAVKNIDTKVDVVSRTFDIIKVTKEIDTIDKSIKKIKSKKKNKKKKVTLHSSIQTLNSEYESCDEFEQSSPVATDLPDNTDNQIPSSKAPRIPMHNKVPTLASSNPVATDVAQAKPTILTPFLRQPKILFVKDSVAEAANLRKAEAVTKTRIRFARAMTFISLDHSVESNLQQVVKHNLSNPGRENYQYLVMSAPSNDITCEKNMNTSCRNLLNVAEEALTSHKNLKKVVILNHTPRFDNIKNKKLAEKANATLSHLCKNSRLMGKIAVGSHTLDDFGIGHTHNRRYGSPYDVSYYGVPSGSLEYTKSLTTAIFHELPHLSSSISSRVSDPLPLHNKFLPLQEGNY